MYFIKHIYFFLLHIEVIAHPLKEIRVITKTICCLGSLTREAALIWKSDGIIADRS